MTRRKASVTFLIGLLVAIAPAGAHAQVEELLSSYTGANGVAYMEPMKEAVGNNLSNGLYISGRVPEGGLHARLDINAMVVQFDDADRTFTGTPETFDSPGTPVPTIIGDTEAVTVDDPGGSGAQFVFPGGFNIENFALAVPQLTVGSLWGTEATVRYVAVNFNSDDENNELGDVEVFGFAVRHSVSQYFEGWPVDVAAMFAYQEFKMGENDLLETNAQTYGAQASHDFGILEPYGGLALESFDMDVHYTTDFGGDTEEINLDFDRSTTMHFTAGLTARLAFFHLNGEVNFASQTSFAAGLGLGL
jgi:hypothetical protein